MTPLLQLIKTSGPSRCSQKTTMFYELIEEGNQVLQTSYCAAFICVSFLRHQRILDQTEQGRVATPYTIRAMGSPWNAPSKDCSVLHATYKTDRAEQQNLGRGKFCWHFQLPSYSWGSWRRFLRLIGEQLHFQVFHIGSAESELRAQSRICSLGKVVSCHPTSVGWFRYAW